MKQKLEWAVAPLARVEGREGWDTSDATREAVNLVEEARRRGQTFDGLVAQRGMFGEREYSWQAIAIARKLQERPTNVTKAFRQYAAEADMGAGGQGPLGMEPPDAAESFREAFREHGEFGPRYRDLSGQAAFERLAQAEAGEAVGAWPHDQIAVHVDLIWGEAGQTPGKGFSVAKI
ncbi:MAG: hypothetical protein LC130_09610 [Bryobacterales bacterium]|nr:hypothetical protein [Bryobacterales bacterium]